MEITFVRRKFDKDLKSTIIYNGLLCSNLKLLEHTSQFI